ncbi:MAG: DNA-directed RNA polymerase subunit omega [bacterium]|nr:DNA-directed RNA polymerase subunit omega [bacterium]
MFRFDLIAQAMEKEPNKFLLVHLLSKRMHQLADGADPLSSKTYDADVNTALQEFLDSVIELNPEDEFSDRKQKE